MYNRITEKDLAALREMVSEPVLSRDEINEDYFHDELGTAFGKPDALVRVKSTQEVSRIMQFAYANNFPVVVRGSGTGLVGGAVAIHEGIMIETTLMNKIIELDEENLTVTVQSGVLLMELAQFCNDHGYQYCPDPGEKSATIGGNISTNAGGMRAVKYGVTRDAVRSLTAVLPDGEIIVAGSKVVKNSSGYSIKDLIIGSEGTLAIVTEATLKIIPKPEYTLSILVPFPTISKAISAVPRIIGSNITPVAIEFMTNDVILYSEEYLGKKFPSHDSDAYLLLTFDDNNKDAMLHDQETISDLCLELGAIDVLIVDTEERSNSVWSARSAFLEAIKSSTDLMDECDVVLPRSKIAEFLDFTDGISRKTELRIRYFGHAGDGNLHIYLCRDGMDEDLWLEKKQAVFSALYSEAGKYGGQVSGEHGIGLDKKSYLASSLGEVQINLMKGIKKVFDPKNILNPGKII